MRTPTLVAEFRLPNQPVLRHGFLTHSRSTRRQRCPTDYLGGADFAVCVLGERDAPRGRRTRMLHGPLGEELRLRRLDDVADHGVVVQEVALDG